MSGTNSGAGNTGTGHGSDPNSRGGISPANGPGGAGNIPAGTSAVPGVSISGGSTSNIITLPSFGSDSSGADPAAGPRSSTKQRKKTLDVDVIASASAAGAFEPYKNLLHGEKHISYIDSSLGIVVMEYADESTAQRSFGAPLAAPAALSNDLPDGLPRARMVVTCTLDASGKVKNLKVLDPGPAQMTAKVVAALRNWKFQPAMRNSQPVEVTAILGFGIDTNDRF
jgi:TonB family protein